MKIVVCIKEVVDVSFSFALDQQTLEPLAEDVFFKVNPADLCAAEIALQLKEQHGAEVTYLSFGPPRVEKTLRECLSLGGDHAVRIWDSSIAPGSQGKTYLLAKVIQSLEADLVLCGSQSLDEGRGETPAALAELLDLPQMVGVTACELAAAQGVVTASRKLERGYREEIECALPALLALEAGMVVPRYAPLAQRLKAFREPVQLLEPSAIGVDPAELKQWDALRTLERRALPRPRPKKSFNLESGLTAEQRMEMMMAGASRKTKSDLLEGQPTELAEQLTALAREKILKTP